MPSKLYNGFLRVSTSQAEAKPSIKTNDRPFNNWSGPPRTLIYPGFFCTLVTVVIVVVVVDLARRIDHAINIRDVPN